MNRSTVGLIFATTICVVAFVEARSVYSEVFVSENTQRDVKGATSTEAMAPSDAAADNTKRNVRDKDEATLTPPDQAQGSKADVEITRRIRKALVADKSLSTNAKNVKIITLDGQVTLRGPVESNGEQKIVLVKAKEVAGGKNVKNQLEVKRP